MAEQTFGVRLTANVTSYIASMRAAGAATSTMSAGATKSLASVGARMQATGKLMTIGLTAPLVAAGIGAVKLANGFDQSMAKIQALVGISGSQVETFKGQVLELAGETARAPQELADALYFITSAGIDASDAMGVLEASAKASAAGLGDTATIADAVTSAVNAYGLANLSASDATDVLLATVREGKAEPTQLADSIGRVIAPAQNLGVAFDQVGAALASMSVVGLDASEGATALRGILMALERPTVKQTKVLDQMGMSLTQIRSVVRDQGLLPALTMLANGAKNLGDEAITSLFGNVRALNGVLTMTGANAGRTNQIFHDLAGTTGDTNRAFDIMSQTAGFKMKQAWVEIQTTLIGVGDKILPAVAKIVGTVGDIADAFGNLPGPTQNAILGILGLVALSGPFLMFAGTIIRNATLISGALEAIGVAGVAAQLGIAAVVVAAGVIAADVVGRQIDPQSDSVLSTHYWKSTLPNAIKEGLLHGQLLTRDFWGASTVGSTMGAEQMAAYGEQVKAARAEQEKALATAKAFADVQRAGQVFGAPPPAKGAAEIAQVQEMWQRLGDTVQGVSDAADIRDIWERLAGAVKDESEATAEAAQAARDHAAALQKEAQALLDQVSAFRGSTDAVFALHDAERQAATSKLDLVKAQQDLNDAQADPDATPDDIARAYIDLKAAEDGVVTSADNVADAHVRIREEHQKARGVTLSATAALDTFNNSLIRQAQEATGPVRSALEAHITDLNKIKPKVATRIQTLIDKGDVAGAEALLKHTSRSRKVAMRADADAKQADKDLSDAAHGRTARFRTDTDTREADTKLGKAAVQRAVRFFGVPDIRNADTDLNRTARTRNARIHADPDTGNAESAINNTARHRNTTISVGSNSSSVNSAIDYAARDRTSTITIHANITKMATGGPVHADQMALVGEQGPELVALPAGSYVHPHARSMRMLDDLGVRRYQTGGTVTATNPPTFTMPTLPPRARTLLADANALLKLAEANEASAKALREQAKATTDANEKDKLRAQADKLAQKAENERSRAENLATRARKLYTNVIDAEARVLERNADRLRKDAQALRDAGDAAMEAARKRSDALHEQAAAVRDTVDAEIALHRAQEQSAEALSHAQRAMTTEGVTVQQQADAMDAARTAALDLADAEVARARAQAAARGQTLSDARAAEITRESLRKSIESVSGAGAGRVRANLKDLIRDLDFPAQFRELRQAQRALARGRARQADANQQARADAQQAKHLDKLSNSLERLSHQIEKGHLTLGTKVEFHVHGNLFDARELRRLINHTIQESVRKARAGSR